uniref:AMP-dependent synthetase/ligase domain-containing protein n=1 Tax=Physcomitrium patens TaxID=3218 RepID=A0A7I4DQI2_PHYPA
MEESGFTIDLVSEAHLVKAGLSREDAGVFFAQLQAIVTQERRSQSNIWQRISKELLRPWHPFPLHQLLYYSSYGDWDVSTRGPPLGWIPTPEIARQSNLGRILERKGREVLGEKYRSPTESLPELQRWSFEHPELYLPLVWEHQSLIFHQHPRCFLDTSDEANQGGVWLPGAHLNVAECCLAAKGSKTDSSIAIMYRNEGEDDLPVREITLSQLRADVSRVANSLEALGFKKGDSIAIDMQMNVQAVTAYLAIILAGCVVVSIPDSFVAKEIAIRIRISKAKAIFTQDVIQRGGKKLPLYSRVIESKAPLAIVLPADGKASSLSLRNGDLSWDEFLVRAEHLSRPDEYKPVIQSMDSYTNILFSSGTTGEPKAIPWTQHTPLRCAADSWAHLDSRQGDVLCWPTNLGWMVGPMIVYSAFVNGATLALYNGSPLDRGFGKFVQDAKVTMLGTVPSLVRAWKASGCMANLDWTAIRAFGSSGETSSVDDDLWLSAQAGYKPVLECCGGTELGAMYVGGNLVQPQAFAAFSTVGMTFRIYILDDSNNPYPDEAACTGELVLHPHNFGSSSTLLNADHHKVYYQGMPHFNGKQLRRHGDIFQRFHGGFYKAHGRSDDTMNLGGIKASAIEIEQVCNKAHESVQETAAISVQPPRGGPEELVIAAVLKPGYNISSKELQKIFLSHVMSNLNPLFKVHSY